MLPDVGCFLKPLLPLFHFCFTVTTPHSWKTRNVIFSLTHNAMCVPAAGAGAESAAVSHH